jgi:hypothetical protein
MKYVYGALLLVILNTSIATDHARKYDPEEAANEAYRRSKCGVELIRATHGVVSPDGIQGYLHSCSRAQKFLQQLSQEPFNSKYYVESIKMTRKGKAVPGTIYKERDIEENHPGPMSCKEASDLMESFLKKLETQGRKPK